MNREIKFRGKSLNTNCWVYGDLRQDKIRGKAYIEYEVDPDTVGQYTGLKDKNGKEIYEGDIIESKRYGHIVMYDKNLAGFCSANVKYPEDLCGLNQQWINECGKVVIGNVTDNPELMK